MADEDSHDEIEWNPFDYVEESRDVLEKIAAVRIEREPFPEHLLTSDPLWAREIVQRSKAERAKDAERDYTVPAPEIPARVAVQAEWPRAALSLLKKLDGWETSGWFMRGPQVSGRRVLATRSCFVLRGQHETDLKRRIRVVFMQKDDGKWDRQGNWMFTPDQAVNWHDAASVKELEAYCADPERPAPIPLEGA